jgi:carboxylesterase type B
MRFAFATLAALLLPLGLASGSFDPVELHARQIQPSPNVASNTTGTSNVTVHGVTVNALNTTRFLGIPFAEPPMGSLRFAPPVPANLTKYAFGINATVNGPSCPQPVRALYGNSSEDCLHLNVYTPSEQSLASLRATAAALGGNNSAALTDAYESGLPVLVWIYGGK